MSAIMTHPPISLCGALMIGPRESQLLLISVMMAFFWLGKLIEVNDTKKIFTAPDQKLTEDYITGRFG